jgi:hypothetical protein
MANQTADPKAIAAAVKRVMPLVRKLPEDLRLPAAAIKEVALGGSAVVRAKSRRLEGSPVIYAGDLILSGSLDIGCVLIVLGDLEVGGVIEALYDDATLVVGGSIKARGLNCTDHICAAGSITAEVVFCELASKLVAGDGIAADLVILEDASVKPTGKLAAKDKVVLTYPTSTGIDRLKALLDPKAFGHVDGDPVLYDYTNLFDVLRRGKPWRAAKKKK